MRYIGTTLFIGLFVYMSIFLVSLISCKFDTSLMDEQILMELHSCGIRPEDVHEGR